MHEKREQAALDIPDWLILDVDDALAAIADDEARARAVERVLTKYAGAAFRAPNAALRERADSALFHFLTARPAPRKRWSLGEAQALHVVGLVRAAAERWRAVEPG